mgnify:FL=1
MPIHSMTKMIIVMPMPIVPMIMPINMVTPSLFSRPSDITSIPRPGGKLTKGMGSATATRVE